EEERIRTRPLLEICLLDEEIDRERVLLGSCPLARTEMPGHRIGKRLIDRTDREGHRQDSVVVPGDPSRVEPVQSTAGPALDGGVLRHLPPGSSSSAGQPRPGANPRRVRERAMLPASHSSAGTPCLPRYGGSGLPG